MFVRKDLDVFMETVEVTLTLVNVTQAGKDHFVTKQCARMYTLLSSHSLLNALFNTYCEPLM